MYNGAVPYQNAKLFEWRFGLFRLRRTKSLLKHSRSEEVPIVVAQQSAASSSNDLEFDLREAVQTAKRVVTETVGEDGEPWQSIAFRAVLERLLKAVDVTPEETVADKPANVVPIRPSTDVPIGEFQAQLRIDSHPDRILAIAYYHQKRDEEGVTTRDLIDAYNKARIRRPQNYPDVIASLLRRGRLIEGRRRDGLKTWVITHSGEAYVEHKL